MDDRPGIAMLNQAELVMLAGEVRHAVEDESLDDLLAVFGDDAAWMMARVLGWASPGEHHPDHADLAAFLRDVAPELMERLREGGGPGDVFIFRGPIPDRPRPGKPLDETPPPTARLERLTPRPSLDVQPDPERPPDPVGLLFDETPPSPVTPTITPAPVATPRPSAAPTLASQAEPVRERRHIGRNVGAVALLVVLVGLAGTWIAWVATPIASRSSSGTAAVAAAVRPPEAVGRNDVAVFRDAPLTSMEAEPGAAYEPDVEAVLDEPAVVVPPTPEPEPTAAAPKRVPRPVDPAPEEPIAAAPAQSPAAPEPTPAAAEPAIDPAPEPVPAAEAATAGPKPASPPGPTENAIAIHANIAGTDLSPTVVERMLRGTIARWPDGQAATLVLPPAGSPEMAWLCSEVVHMPETAYLRHLARQSFGGVIQEPVRARTVSEAAEVLRATPGAIGALPRSQAAGTTEIAIPERR